MADSQWFDPVKIRARLEYDRDEIASKEYAAGRLRDFADDEERDATRIRNQRTAFANTVMDRAQPEQVLTLVSIFAEYRVREEAP